MTKVNHNLGYFDLSEHNIKELVFVRENETQDLRTSADLYYWEHDRKGKPWQDCRRFASDFYPTNKAGRATHLSAPDSGPLGSGDTDKFFAFYCADCFDPPLFLVAATDEEEAYDSFLDYASEHLGLRIDPKEYADYGIKRVGAYEDGTPTYDWNDYEGRFDCDGNPVDDESIHYFPLRLVRIELL